MENKLKVALEKISKENLSALTLELVKIKSETGDSDEVAKYVSEYLNKLGIENEFDPFQKGIPNVVAVMKGKGKGKLGLLGHMDTIPVHGTHAPYIKDGIIYGRGACDMKAGIAAMMEIARIIKEENIDVGGELYFGFHSAHEIPGKAEGVYRMIEKNQLGDAVICMEGDTDLAVTHGKGLGNFRITVKQKEESVHELRSKGMSNPVMYCANLINAIDKQNKEWSKTGFKDLGGQTIFVGQIEGGDYFNRLPSECVINGSVRLNPGTSTDQMTADVDRIINSIDKPADLEIDRYINYVGEGYSLKENETIVESLKAGYKTISGKELTEKGVMYVGDASKTVNAGNLPSVYYGVGLGTAHHDVEYVDVSDIEFQCKVTFATIFDYMDKTK